ncbi:hypothetical protein [Nonomuraea sp. NPDC050786]|uniref:hypothetical protein n=1 Tax=Nonomuraea sp. NPDC050786 TaxID=3154840 RepID=UPI003409C58E
MSTAFAAAVRERVRLAWQALQAARHDDDVVYAGLVPEDEWEDARRLTRAHGVHIVQDPQGRQGA